MQQCLNWSSTGANPRSFAPLPGPHDESSRILPPDGMHKKTGGKPDRLSARLGVN